MMDTKTATIKLLAQTVYELRLLLAHHLGSKHKADTAEIASAHLVYALHNEALAILENRSEDIDLEHTLAKIQAAEHLSISEYSPQLQHLIKEIRLNHTN